MDALKLIPQIFFDIIGRMVPGAVAMLLYAFYFDRNWSLWRTMLNGPLGLTDKQEASITYVLIWLLFASYAVGHLLSPLTKLVQRIGEMWQPWTMSASNSKAYDWLRLHHPEAGAHCAKLRAEFTMYNGFAATFLLANCGLIASNNSTNKLDAVAFFLLAIVMTLRGREGLNTFRNSVEHFHEAARLSSSTASAP